MEYFSKEFAVFTNPYDIPCQVQTVLLSAIEKLFATLTIQSDRNDTVFKNLNSRISDFDVTTVEC